MARHLAEPTTTQTAYPWRAVLRTAFAVIVAFAAGAPLIFEAVAQSDASTATGGAGVVLGVAAAITRVLALPWTEDFLRSYLPFLAAGKD